MVRKLSIAVLFAGWGAVGLFLLTNHTGLATRVANYLYFLFFFGVLSRFTAHEKN